MNKHAFLLLPLLCLIAGPTLSIAETPTAHITLINVQALPESDLEQIRAFTEENLFVSVKARTVDPYKGKDATELGRALSSLMTPEDVCFVALISLPDETIEPLVIAPDNRWAVINISTLRTKGVSHDLLTARVGKQVMRSIAMLFGVGYCKDPRCANRSSFSAEALDKTGRNYSAPCLDRFLDEAVVRGLETIKRRSIRYRKKMRGEPLKKTMPAPAPAKE